VAVLILKIGADHENQAGRFGRKAKYSHEQKSSEKTFRSATFNTGGDTWCARDVSSLVTRFVGDVKTTRRANLACNASRERRKRKRFYCSEAKTSNQIGILPRVPWFVGERVPRILFHAAISWTTN